MTASTVLNITGARIRRYSLRHFENFHIILWLLKDSFWILNWKIPGTIMVLPAITLAVFIAWRSRRLVRQFWFNVAVCCWIMANSIWMLGEFFFDDKTRPIALVFFAIGLVCTAGWKKVK